VADDDKPVIHLPTESEVEAFGEVEVDVKVEPVGGTKPRKVQFSVFECEGAPICKLPPEISQAFFEQDSDRAGYEVADEEGLQPGDRIIVPMLHGWAWATVEQDEDGKLSARSGESHGHVLKYSDKQPDGPRWVVTGSYNLRGLERLEVER
jgi:hypothetical protein